MESISAPFDIDTYVVRPDSERRKWEPSSDYNPDEPFELK
jgi:hypothetical protein